MRRPTLDAATVGASVKLAIFLVVTTLATGMLVVVVGNLSFGDSRRMQAVFSDATGVVAGDDVRIAGVKVGSVRDVEIVERDRALVSFDVDVDAPVTESTEATIRFRNLVGQRYIALTRGTGASTPLEEGATIPIDRTAPALDLSVLFNGFRPLFEALTPEDINKLSFEIISVFQGESGTLESLLDRTASVTSTLADRDEVIGDLLVNLNEVMETIGDRDDELSSLIVRLREFIGGLAQDREAILGPLDSISELAVETSGLIGGIREPFVKDIKELRKVAGTLDRNRAEIDRATQILPIKLRKIGRTAIYGSWFNFYLCNFEATVRLPKPVGTVSLLDYSVGTGRCDLP
ncbi:MCE family protein [Nocardioides massiliensis]|uniref:Phospholipid/cholesterol/gamma-HCH transport system substrate-binding protein n=1 Tax=Nocardioides massiliensis TaxID=1325935 RepID=A0ABT9NPI3_9ACTN|nr:MCE family protein [Nocardioides massiliensis]MDP9821985.1 phospholipid/cholesterol/gamma-HCH transport system substrate-binding protein [Nocardioides massiliensis]